MKRTVYELENYRKALELEIQKAELQLQNVEKRLKHLKIDTWVYLGMIILPRLLLELLSKMCNLNALFPRLLGGIGYVIISFVYVIVVPFMIYNFINSLLLWMANRESSGMIWAKPDIRNPRLRVRREPESSYTSEKGKLVGVLGQYYLYQQKLEPLLQQARREDTEQAAGEELTMETVLEALEEMPFYEEIRPFNPFKGKQVKNARIITLIIVAGWIAFWYWPRTGTSLFIMTIIGLTWYFFMR